MQFHLVALTCLLVAVAAVPVVLDRDVDILTLLAFVLKDNDGDFNPAFWATSSLAPPSSRVMRMLLGRTMM
ncbi:hypothetical protein Q9L58_006385 [Maublancomyces gigas]|uniref:Secreted protein n=1 Tax=Discina gigas TaxID=1032678 RepID=A0ABR3GFV2_9PEZI